MLVGHVAVGLLGKRLEPAISLGTFVLAWAYWMEILRMNREIRRISYSRPT